MTPVSTRLPGRLDRIPLACAVIAVLAGLAAIWASNATWPDSSALVKVAESDAIAGLARAIDPDFVLVGGQEHYDGIYYYAIALDPLALGGAHDLVDQAGYRYGRPMHGWLAALISLGHATAIPDALLVLSLLGLGLGAYVTSLLCRQFGRTPWGGLVIAMSPGLLFATTVSVTETMGAAMAIALVLAWMRRARPWVIAALSVLLSLYREQLVLVLVGVAGYAVVDSWRTRRRPTRTQAWRLAALATGPIVLACWLGYLRTRFAQPPAPIGEGNVDAPLMGWLASFRWAIWLQQHGNLNDAQIGSTSPSVLIAIAVLLLAALWAARDLRSPVDGVLIMQVVLMAVLSWRTLLYPHELYRIPALSILAALGALLLGQRMQDDSGGIADSAQGEPTGSPPAQAPDGAG